MWVGSKFGRRVTDRTKLLIAVSLRLSEFESGNSFRCIVVMIWSLVSGALVALVI